jgi:hypothetical protein
MEVDEGRWGRSDGQIGSLKVICKSAWLLHFSAASVRLDLQGESSVRRVVGDGGRMVGLRWND